MIFYSVNLLCIIFILLNEHTDALDNCPAVQEEKEVGYSTLKFSKPVSKEMVGFSVDLLFTEPVNIDEAYDGRNEKANVTRISDWHWIISVFKVPKSDPKRAEFSATYTDNGATKLEGLILNGELLCGLGVTKVILPSSFPYEGSKKCKPKKETRFENETQIIISEDFASPRVGFVMDVVFDSDVDDVETYNLYRVKHSDRHYSMFNSGKITSEGKRVEVIFKVHHKGKPAPGLLAIVMNNVAICGFSTTLKAFNYETVASVSKMQDEETTNLRSLENLITASIVFSVLAFLAAIASGLFAWKLTSFHSIEHSRMEPHYSEPIYATTH